MTDSTRFQLSFMMFLEFFIWGLVRDYGDFSKQLGLLVQKLPWLILHNPGGR